MTSISIKEYFAAAGSRFTDNDARKIGPVLAELSELGDVTAGAVVDAARSTNSPLHSYFEWDDAKAAHQYREGQANEIISAVRVRVVTRDGERTARAYRVKEIEQVRLNEVAPRQYNIPQPDPDELFADALAELQQWRIKYRPYAEMLGKFKDVAVVIMNQIGEMLSEFEGNPQAPKPLAAIEDLREWAQTHGAAAGPAAAFAEQFSYLIEAIGEAESVFDPDAKLESPLARENRLLRERLALYEAGDRGVASLAQNFGLTASEAKVLTAISKGNPATKATLMNALYPSQIDRPDDPKIVDVFVCKLRKKLESRGIIIETVWGQGYALNSRSKSAVQEFLESA